MMGQQTPPRTSIQHMTEPWCERTLDMSGYAAMEATSLPSDEQFNPDYSTALHENDYHMINSRNQSPVEYILGGDQSESVLEDESNNMFDPNYSELDYNLKEWLPSTQEVNAATENFGDLLTRTDSENSLVIFSSAAKDNKKQSTAKKSSHPGLSVFAFEEPHIKEEDLSPCPDNKLADMEVAAEEEVVTEQEDCKTFYGDESRSKIDLGSSWQQSSSVYYPVVPKQETSTSVKSLEDVSSSPAHIDPSAMASPFKFSPADTMSDWFEQLLVPSPPSEQACSQLRLNIDAAMSVGPVFGSDLPDTPEVLQPVLKPNKMFDLVAFLTSDNNNNFSTSSSFRQQVKPEGRRGKSSLTLQELRASQSSQPRPVKKEHEPTLWPSTYTSTYTTSSCERLMPTISATATTTTSRPRRESTSRLYKPLQEDFVDPTASSDDEYSSAPKNKRRRTVSSSSRRRLASESDQSSVCNTEDAKYRERRDRNNLSSQRSRQKRKQAQELQRRELVLLEQRNMKLKRKESELAVAIAEVLHFTKESLKRLSKANTQN